ncbi:MAG: amylo-alpha-1,6-glucosidase [Lentimicrobiaceae bacterium]|nr:amylo-alpha-1,6-glucosidase [Lentimicrobiaceae bacterium]
MSYITLDKSRLVNLEYILNLELLRTNRLGAFSCTTIAGCNTRKYHGLIVVPQPQLDNNHHILLSSLDETIIQRNEEFHFGVHMYPNGIFEPKGHKYLRDFVLDPIPKLTYRVGGVVLDKEIIFVENEARLLIRYTLREATSETKLRLKPFLAYRNIHQLTRENYDADRHYKTIANGASWQMYAGYSPLYFQASKEIEYTHVPHWYYNIEYIREIERGYPAQEDLYVPGFFEVSMKKNETLIVSIGLTEKDPALFKRQFSLEAKKIVPRNSFENCLIQAAQQFIIKDGQKVQVMAGFPWFGSWSRDTFMALPGLTLIQKDEKNFKSVLATMIESMNGALFPHSFSNNRYDFTSVDAPLWFFGCLYRYENMMKKSKNAIWKTYRETIITIIEKYSEGTDYNIKMLDNGLLWAGNPEMALTWMDVYSEGTPVTPRYGLAVEVNVLWYNALSYAITLAETDSKSKIFAKKWRAIVEKINQSFEATFWDQEAGYLADFVNEEEKNMLVRPNMIMAVAAPYSPLSDEKQMKVFKVVQSELLTPRGLRSLSPKSSGYKGILTGNQYERDQAYHQGTVFPWLIEYFCEAALKLMSKSAVSYVKDIYEGFEPTLREAGLGTISEVFDGDPPYIGRGAISQAISTAALLRLKYMIDQNTNG